jgi:hypothetical protein
VAGANYGVRATAGNAATVPFTARGFASQTANLQEWQNSAGTAIASVGSAGALTVPQITLNADTWSIRSDGNDRIYFGGGANYITFYKGFAHNFRSTSDVTVASISNTGDVVASGTVTNQGIRLLQVAGGTLRGVLNCPSWDTSYVALRNGTLAETGANTAIAQNSVGDTSVGAASGRGLSLAVGGAVVGLVTSTGIAVTGNLTASGTIIHVPPSSVTLATNGQFAVEMTSNTDGNFAYRGSDGVTRRTALTFGTNPTAIPSSVVFVDSPADLPAVSGGIHTLAADTTYIIAGTVDLVGNRIVCGNNTTIIGAGSSENCRLKSTGLTGTALITSVYSLPMRSLTIEADVALNLNASGTPTAALDWYGVNFNTCGTVGTIANYSNFIATDCAWLSSGAMTFDGTIGTVGFSQCIFTPAATKTALIVASTATITRRFRVIYSAFVATSGMTGINFSTSASVPDENYILDTVNFSGGGTYTTGVTQTSDKCRWVSCVGVANTVAIAQMYMKNNATATDVITQNVRYPMAGTTEFAALSQRFEHVLADNAVRYTSAVPRRVKVLVSFSLEAANNNVIGVYIGKCAAGNSIVPDTDRISDSEVYVTTTGTRPDAGFVQALIDIVENDKIYVIVQNTSAATDVTVKFMHMIVEQAVS